MVYYNEHDAFAAQWLRNLIAAGELPYGDVDERDIQDVRAADLIGYVQCHFFAGVGGWPLALRLAGWGDRPVWTGSCPCQPFSVAGKGLGDTDQRHLWPEFRRLIAECSPAVVFGEQVASAAGRQWLAGVRADLEGLDYAVGAADLCAACQGAPHIRQRLFWVADTEGPRGRPNTGAVRSRSGERLPEATGQDERREEQRTGHAEYRCAVGPDRMEHSNDRGREGSSLHLRPGRPRAAVPDAGGPSADGGLEHAEGDRRLERGAEPSGRSTESRCEPGGLGDASRSRLAQRPGPEERPGAVRHEGPSLTASNPWADAVLVLCRDGKARRIPTQSALFPLASRLPGRVGQLRAYGNAIVPAVAAEFVRAYLDCA